ncbi:MAG: OmpA family protein [Polyangiaceae bacterium]|nr:OmpA family protein [Polyangiaceae bacterium]
MTDAGPMGTIPPPPAEAVQSRSAPALPWLLLAASVIVLIIVGVVGYRSFNRAADLEQELAAMSKEVGARKAELEALRQQHQEHERKRQSLEKGSAELASELAETKAANEAAKAALAQAKAELMRELSAEIKKGEIVVQEKGTGLIVDVSDKVLFETGEAEIGRRGKVVLRQVSASLRRMSGHVFQIGGHTDDDPIVSAEVRAKYPTNWELSSARATQVVRFLAEQCGVPGNRLVAAGYARFRPVAPNTTGENKARNRRIEIAVLREARGGG